jgi:hypothetical protein
VLHWWQFHATQVAGRFHESVSSVQLFMPDLVPAGTAATATPQLPRALHRLLARARLSRLQAEDYIALLCSTFGVERRRDWPVAALTLLADGLNPGTHYWLRADPVHLRANQANLVLLEGEHISIADAEARELVDALNGYFAPDGLVFHAPSARRWYVRTPAAAEIETVSLRAASGRSIGELLPRGAHAQRWHGWINEAQMLLHAHPVNAQREGRGELPINSLWFWGGGVLPPRPPRCGVCVWTAHPLARGLALWAGLEPQPQPEDAEPVLARTGEHWITLQPPGRSPSAATLEGLDRAWFAPLAAALSRRTLSIVRLHAFHGGQALRFDLAPNDLWKLWRRGLNLWPAHA